MNRAWRALTIAAGFVLIAGVGVWNQAFRAPPVHVLALPAALVPLESPMGHQWLDDARFVADYAQLARHFTAQSRRAFCGVASAVTVLNAMKTDSTAGMTQATFFDGSAAGWLDGLVVSLQGMSLPELGAHLRARGAGATVVHASDIDLPRFRALARDNLATPGNFVLVNYQRSVLGQDETGHISPLAAYNAAQDRFLVLDVAAHKYPPVWVPAEALWNAMNTVDGASGKTRGLVAVAPALNGGAVSPPTPASPAPPSPSRPPQARAPG